MGFLQDFRNWASQLPDDTGQWTFGGLQRADDGSFQDADWVQVVQDGTENVAGGSSARNIPCVLKAVEMQRIQQGREWDLASLDGLREPFKLKHCWSFSIVESRHEHPDSIEPYPGLLAEDTKEELVPGSGL
ncbi:Psi-producing oxygenase A [Colletotrichum tanaceti]|uniref:Psi-producing oxygenase A n=1 Tax=Colletotrichum tanaceti TaxID=1306861 RepID=A0A4U6X1J9_9PEZI|nr:Psi-producing oxygenase A [Colletotrichum tanaceti]